MVEPWRTGSFDGVGCFFCEWRSMSAARRAGGGTILRRFGGDAILDID